MAIALTTLLSVAIGGEAGKKLRAGQEISKSSAGLTITCRISEGSSKPMVSKPIVLHFKLCNSSDAPIAFRYKNGFSPVQAMLVYPTLGPSLKKKEFGWRTLMPSRIMIPPHSEIITLKPEEVFRFTMSIIPRLSVDDSAYIHISATNVVRKTKRYLWPDANFNSVRSEVKALPNAWRGKATMRVDVGRVHPCVTAVLERRRKQFDKASATFSGRINAIDLGVPPLPIFMGYRDDEHEGGVDFLLERLMEVKKTDPLRIFIVRELCKAAKRVYGYKATPTLLSLAADKEEQLGTRLVTTDFLVSISKRGGFSLSYRGNSATFRASKEMRKMATEILVHAPFSRSVTKKTVRKTPEPERF
ncbi:MAG: hypothetical protein JRC77_10280 [Deltaproteobacteria bacterium]|nr:hypothetical protein [Deltaproteobacteria bacterium]